MLESRRLNQTLFLEYSTDCIKLLDLEARLLFMNGLGCKALEIDDFDRVANTCWLDFWKGTFADAARAAVETAKAGGIGHFQGYCPTWKELEVVGRCNHAAFWTLRESQNNSRFPVSRDITEFKADAGALRESEERFSLAQSAAHLVAWDWDLATNVIALCGKYAHLYGLTPERATLTYDDWLNPKSHPDDREQFQALIRETLERTHLLYAEFRVIWPGGTKHWLAATGTVFLDDSGRPIRAMGVSGEITERKRSEDMLRQSQANAYGTELDTARRLQHLATQLIKINANRGAVRPNPSNTGMAIIALPILPASKLFYLASAEPTESSRLLGHRGFTAEASQTLGMGATRMTRTTCGEALRTGRELVVVPDVRNCDFMAGSEDLDGYLGARDPCRVKRRR